MTTLISSISHFALHTCGGLHAVAAARVYLVAAVCMVAAAIALFRGYLPLPNLKQTRSQLSMCAKIGNSAHKFANLPKIAKLSVFMRPCVCACARAPLCASVSGSGGRAPLLIIVSYLDKVSNGAAFRGLKWK